MKIVLLFIIAYLLGSIPSGVWVGKLFFHKDIRKFGSGNMGTTNTFRVLGKPAGITVFILDVLKGTLATWLPLLFGVAVNPLWFGVVAVIGHTLPLFAGFKGGKAVATSAGMLLGYSPAFMFSMALLFLVLLYITSMVSLSSILIAAITTIATIVLPYIAPFILPQHNWLLTCLCAFLTVYIIYRHRENIKRIKNGTENRVSFGLGAKKHSTTK